MNNSYSFRVPAGTANLGPGFDALSLALECYLRVRVEPAASMEIVVHGLDVSEIPTTPDNLILRVANRVAERRNRKLPPFRLTIDNDIPLARGLGSSAAAIIAGITCYELVAEDELSELEVLRYAFEFERHPDNLTAAFRGGLIASAASADGEVWFSKLMVADGVQPVVIIPEFEIRTKAARSILPQSYSREDAVYNIQRAALTIAALTTGNWPILHEAMRDRIHQPYRRTLVPGLEEILALTTPGLLSVALSGAGPTILAFAKPADAKRVGGTVADVFEKHGIKATPHVMNIDGVGRYIEPS